MDVMELQSIVDRAAHRYAALCWWADIEDLKQEAWVAVLEAQQTWNPVRGPFHPYGLWAAILHLRNYLWAASKPVTGRKNHGPVLRGIQVVSAASLIGRAGQDPFEAEREEAWWAQLREQVEVTIRHGRRGEIAARVLLDKEKPAAIAEELGCSVHRVHRASSDARKRVRQDTELRLVYKAGA